MRVVAGEFSSRKLKTLKGNKTRPTQDRVKEAVFSSLGTYFDGGRILDLYAGSGAIGIEAISRGMDEAVFVDSSHDAISIIKENIDMLGIQDKTKVLNTKDINALSILKDENYIFDYVYLDPPYALQHNDNILHLLDEYNLLSEGAIIIIESLKEDAQPSDTQNIHFIKDSDYGITKIRYYRNEEKK